MQQELSQALEVPRKTVTPGTGVPAGRPAPAGTGALRCQPPKNTETERISEHVKTRAPNLKFDAISHHRARPMRTTALRVEKRQRAAPQSGLRVSLPGRRSTMPTAGGKAPKTGPGAIDSLLFKKYPGQQQVDLKVRVNVPGSWFGAGAEGTLNAAETYRTVAHQ